jgi:hypothetical protein
MIRTSTGVIASFGKDAPFTDELVLSLPDRFRLTLDVGSGLQKARVIQVVNGESGWQSTGGMVTELGKERLGELREEAYLLWLATLVPLLKDDAFELKPLPEGKVNDRPAAVVQVTRKGHGDVRLYFDKASGLLVKSERRAKEAGQPFDQEYVYGEHKEFDGVTLPTRQQELRGGKRFAELAEMAYKFPRTVEDSTFGRP